MKHLLFFCSLLFLAACSGGGKTSAQLKISGNFIFGGANLASFVDGGLMVWGQGPNGQAFGRALVGTDSLNLDLPNGTWTFYAMAWDKTTENFTGTARCAQSVSFLKGEPVTANLTLTNQNCSQAVFGGTIHGTTPNVTLAPTKFEWCGSEPSQVTSPAHKCTDDQFSPDRKAAKGHGTSYRLRLRSYDRKPGAPALFMPGEIVSQCFDGTGSPASPEHSQVAMTAPGLPAGLGNTTPFHISMEVFVGSTDCDATASPNNRGFVPVELPHGLQSQQPRLKYVVDTTMAPAKHKLYVQISDADICNGRETQMPFAAGLGTADRQYLICSARQLQKVATAPATNHYKLLKDIDLNPLSKGALSAPTTAQEPFYACLDLGGNFFPIGADLNTCAANPPAFFTGSINGNSKRIKGLRMRLEGKNNVGLAAIVSDTGHMRNLILEQPEVGGRSHVGVLAGQTTSNSGATFSNIELVEPDVEGRDDMSTCVAVGSLIGRSDGTNFQVVSVRRGRVESSCNRTGGIVGDVNTSMANFVSFSGIVEARDMNGGSEIGGLFGYASQLNLGQSRAEAYVYANQLAGGLVGNSSASSYTNVYAHHGLRVRSQASIKAGGLFGLFTGSSTFNMVHHAYASGVIGYGCTNGDTTCSIGEVAGEISGVTPGDFVNVYFNDLGYSSVNAHGTLGNSLTPTQLYAGVAADTAGLVGGSGGLFTLQAGDLPRLSFETPFHPCRLNGAFQPVGTQINQGRGATKENPILVCNPSQLQTAFASHPSLHYSIQGFVDGPSVNAIGGNFSGSINGNGNAIVDTRIVDFSSGAALFSTLSGSISNLHIIGGTIETMGGSGTSAFLATTLTGTVDKLYVQGLRRMTSKEGGLLFDTIATSGRVLNSRVDGELKSSGGGYVGGVAKFNYGLIENLKLWANFSASTGTGLNYNGGIVSENYGVIRRVEAGIRMDDRAATSGTGSALGVQINRPGALMEDITFERSQFESNGLNAHGIAAINDGTIRRVLMSGSVRLYDGNPRPAFAIAGTNGGNITSTIFTDYAQHLDPNPNAFGNVGTLVPDGANCALTLDSYAATGAWTSTFVASPQTMLVTVGGVPYRTLTYAPSTWDVVNVAEACGNIMSTDFSVAHSPLDLAGVYVHPNLAENNLSTFSSWNGQVDSAGRSTWIANMDSEVDQRRLVNIYLAYLSGQPLPEPPPTWEFKSGDGLRLFSFE